MRAVIYARYSTDLQTERSIEDQIALCRDYAEREGFAVIRTFEDRARSGASVLGRDGLLGMLALAAESGFDVLVVEHADRIARSMRDLADIHEKLAFRGIQIRAVHSGGTMDTAMIGLFGLVGQMQREDGAKKVRRGMAGVIRDKRHAGGPAYGYRPVAGKPGELVVEPQEAEIVREIFARYAKGHTPRQIAADLNARRVPPPRGRVWGGSAINGNTKRGSGILLNRLYVGEIVWNKTRFLKDPSTGRRVSRPNPAAEWQRAAVPHLRIVGQETFDAVQGRKNDRAHAPAAHARPPKHLLSGLLKCGACSGGMSIKDRRKDVTRIQCTTAKETGSCGHRTAYRLDAIERAVVGGLRERLANREAFARFVKVYNEERRRLERDVTGERQRLVRQLGAAEREHHRALQSYIKGFMGETEAEATLPALLAEVNRLKAAAEAIGKPAKVVQLHAGTVDQYLAIINRLADQVGHGAGDQEPPTAFRDLVKQVVVHPLDEGDEVRLTVSGELARLVAYEFPQKALGVIGGSGGPIPPIPPTDVRLPFSFTANL